jgi:transcriptional regulator with XRE-family HTH domain
MSKTLGERISEKRKSKGLKQEELAEMLGLSAQAVSKWENDVSCPDIMMLPKLSEILGCTVDELLTGKGEVKEAVFLPPEERKDFNKLVLRIIINGAGGERVRVNLPLPLIKVLLDSGVSIDTMGGGKMDGLNIDWQSIVSMVEQGVIGKLVEVDDDGNHVEIVVE